MEEVTNFFKVKKNLINLLVLGILAVGLPLGTKLIRQQQIISSQAAAANVEFEDGTCVSSRNNAKVATCKENITLKFTSPYGVGSTTPPPPPPGPPPPPPPVSSPVPSGSTAPGGACKNNPAPEAVPAGYMWKASCSSTCTVTTDGKGSPACPQNTFDASNVNPATSNWCYDFDPLDGQGRCMMLVRPTCQNPGDAGCAAVPLAICDNGQDGPLDQKSRSNNPNFESMHWVTDCNKYCSTRNDCPVSTDQGITGDNTRWCYGFGKDIHGADQNRCMMLKWGRACTLDWFGTSTLSSSCISCINNARPDVGAYYKGAGGQVNCSDRRIINDWCTKVDPTGCAPIKSGQCATQCSGSQTSFISPIESLMSLVPRGGIVTTVYADHCTQEQVDNGECQTSWTCEGRNLIQNETDGTHTNKGEVVGECGVEPPVEQCKTDPEFTDFVSCTSKCEKKAIWKCPATGATKEFPAPYDRGCDTHAVNSVCPATTTCTGLPGCNTNCSDNPPQTPHRTNQTWKSDCSSTCTTNAGCPKNTTQSGSIDPATSAWCYRFKDGDHCLQLRSTGGTNPPPPTGPPPPPVSGGPTFFRFGENPTELAAATWQVYSTEPVSVTRNFTDSSSGKLFVYAEFKNAAGQITPKTVNINFVGQNPAITNTVCSLDSTSGAISISITGTNFGATQGNSKVTASSNNTTIKSWGDTSVVAELVNAATGTQSLNISLIRGDGAPAAAGSCTVGVSQVSLGATLFCHAPSQKTQDNVVVDLIETGNIGVGLTAASRRPVRETVSIDKDGVIKGLKTKLQQGKTYKLSIKAPKSLRKVVDFTASAGTTTVQNVTLPVGDVFPTDSGDGKINSLDKGELNRQWVVATSQCNRSADFNRDCRVNSIDWACQKDGFNKEDDPEIK